MIGYLQEAFKKFDLLEEEDFNLDASGIEDLESALDDNEKIDFEDIIDPEAETEDELEDSYIGKIILDCKVCHTKLYKNAEEVNFDEETEIANEGDECPFCYSTDGYEIVGQVAPFTDKEYTFEVEPKDDEDDSIEIKTTGKKGMKAADAAMDAFNKKDKVEEAFRKRYSKKKNLKESLLKYREPWADDYEEDLEQFAKDYNLQYKAIKNLGYGKTLYEFTGHIDDFKRALNDGYFYGMYDDDTNYFDESLSESKSCSYWKKKAKKPIFASKKAIKEEFDDALEKVWSNLPSGVKSDLNSFWDNNKDNKWFRAYLTALVTMDIISEQDMIGILKSNIEDGFDDTLGESLTEDKDISTYPDWFKDKDYLLNAPKRYRYLHARDSKKILDDADRKEYELLNKYFDDYYDKPLKEDVDDYKDYEVHVGFAGYVGVEEEYNVSATSIDEAQSEAMMEAQNDIEVMDIADEGDGEYIGIVGFCGYIGVEEEYSVYADDEDDAEYQIREMAADDLTIISVYDEDGNELWNDEDGYLGEGFKKGKKACKDGECCDEECDKVDEALENIDLETEHDKIHIEAEEKGPTGEEIIAPIEPPQEETIMADETEEEPMEDEVDFDINEFDEDSFDTMGESYLKKVYENVNSFKTSSVKQSGNGFIVEGVINFKSGKNKKTSFKFEAKDFRKGKVRFIGENQQITRGKKAFSLTGRINEGKFLSESLNYNYRVDGNRVYGTVKNEGLSDKEGTASQALANAMKDINKCSTAQEVAALADKVIPANKKNEPKVKKLMMSLKTAKTVDKAQQVITNFILKGDGLGVIK